jgi:hypothetical protein
VLIQEQRNEYKSGGFKQCRAIIECKCGKDGLRRMRISVVFRGTTPQSYQK